MKIVNDKSTANDFLAEAEMMTSVNHHYSFFIYSDESDQSYFLTSIPRDQFLYSNINLIIYMHEAIYFLIVNFFPLSLFLSPSNSFFPFYPLFNHSPLPPYLSPRSLSSFPLVPLSSFLVLSLSLFSLSQYLHGGIKSIACNAAWHHV